MHVFGDSPLALRLTGVDFKGADAYRDIFPERQKVAFCYPQSSGRSKLTATFLSFKTDGVVHIYVNGRYYQSDGQPDLKFAFNGHDFYQSNEAFDKDQWTWSHFTVDAAHAIDGESTLTIENLEEKGIIATADSFQVSEVVIAYEPVDPEQPIVDPLLQFNFELPNESVEIPYPLPPGKAPGFKYRGLKGWNFTGEDYLELIPFMVENKLNFLMNCYLSTFTDTERMSAFENCLIPHDNDWWSEFSDEKKREFEAVIQACQENNIIFCFSMNPSYHSTRPFDYADEKDFNDLAKHFLWAQSQGAKWFNIAFDDIKTGIDAKGQALSVKRLLDMLRENDPTAQLVFCPTYYRLTEKNLEEEIAYLKELSQYLPDNVYIFWTGSGRNRTVTAEEARVFRKYIDRPIIFWDNYPVNNASTTVSLGPLVGRDAGLADEVVGYMANPMWPQVSLNKLPLLTAADYAWNTWDYDPKRSIAAAINSMTETEMQAEALHRLIELYPGKSFSNSESGYNPFVDKFNKITELDHSRYIANIYIQHAEEVLYRANRELQDPVFDDARKRLAEDLVAITFSYNRIYGLSN